MRLDILDATGKNAGTLPNRVGGAHGLRNALVTVAGQAGYGVKPLGENVGVVISCVTAQERGSPSWTACVAAVHVDPDSGTSAVQKLTVAMDVGTAGNPDGCIQQIQGSALWGVSHALKEKATMANGAIEQINFDTFEVLRINEVPEIDIVLIQSGPYPAGTGEPVVTVVPAAIANAVHDAVGARGRELPLTPNVIKAAIA